MSSGRLGGLSKSTTDGSSIKTKKHIKIDPIQIAFVQELKRFIGYVDRISKEAELQVVTADESSISDESPARLSNTLFNLWNSYSLKLPKDYFLTQLINTGDYLLKVREYNVAKQHCYGYYLRLLKENVQADDYSAVHFPNGFKDEQRVKETSQAIFGNGLCTLKNLEILDPHMNTEKTVKDLIEVLDDFRRLTQHLIPHEQHCWLVFNGTVHIYKISKWLVDRGHTAKTLQYLVWCCVCMESVIPLMTLKFLSWRGSLYSAVCQCYIDLNQVHAAEIFARRCLQKVHQLAKIEEQSMSEPTPESESIFREVTVKLSAMVFKRVVFESRRPKKIIHRPKTRQNLKELQMLPFPRTASEKLVMDMFEGNASQFFAVLEALSDPSRRTCMYAPPKLDTTEGGDALMDVWGELILAGYELISRCKTFPQVHLIQMARTGCNDLSLGAVLKYIKLAFNYEYWDYYSLAVSHLLPALEENQTATVEAIFAKMTVSLLDAMKEISPALRKDTRPSTCFVDNMLDGHCTPPTLDSLNQCLTAQVDRSSPRRKSVWGERKDDLNCLMNLCSVLGKIKTCECAEMFVKEQGDMLVDAVLLILHSLKDHFSRLVSPSTVKQYLVGENTQNLMRVMKDCNEFSLWLNLYNIDPLLPGEIALKTALLLEAQASKAKSTLFSHRLNAPSDKAKRVEGFLADALLTLRDSMAALEDVRKVKEIALSATCDPTMLVVDPSLSKRAEGDVAHNITVADLQLEMLAVDLRLKQQILVMEQRFKVTESCKKNTLFLAITRMQLATIETKKSEKHLRDSYNLLLKSWSEEKRLHASLQGSEQHGSVPNPPILTSRTSTTMTFKPAPYTPPSGVKVKWYRLYGRSSSGSNIKVRMNDKLYPGLAMEVEAGDPLTVSNLSPYEKYQFAVAAFDEHGKLIAGSIGHSSKPILASPPFSHLTACGHLIQICHKQGVLSVATEACSLLWNFFVLPQTSSKTDISMPTCNYPRLNMKHINGASITLIRHLIESILVSVDIAIREGALFCNVTCDQGPFKTKQLARLGLCEKLLVAVELSGRINDTQLGTQAIIQTYGLLAPLIHHNIMCYPALKVLLYCHAALTELPGVVKQKKHAGNLQHMTGVITFYLSKTLHQWGELEGAALISENGHELLTQFDCLYDELSEQSHAITPNNKKRPVKRPDNTGKDKKGNLKDMIQDPGGAPILKSDTVKAFEAHVLRHSAIYPTNSNGDPDFTGQEDFNLLYTAVANMSCPQAQKEVYKFRRRSRFLELYVRVLEKALLESRPDLVFDWCSEAMAWLTRRNDLLIASKAAGHNKDAKPVKNLEMLKQTVMAKGSEATLAKKNDNKTPGTKNMSKKEGAAELLRAILPDVWRRSCRLQRLRLITHEEMPWRAQLNVILAASCYQQFKEKLETRIKSISEAVESESSRQKNTGGEYEVLPSSMFVVGDVGSMMNSSEDPSSNMEDILHEVNLNISPTLEREKTNLTILLSKKGSVSSVTSRRFRQSKYCVSSDKAREIKMSYSTYLVQTFLSMTQALVLAHRGAHWGLLQNISAQLWRIVMDLNMKMKTLSTSTREMLGLTEATINELLMKPMYHLAEFMLDYVENIISCNEDIEDASTIVGKPEDVDGGASLHFDKFDDTSFVHIRWLHRYVMETLKVLYANSQFEKLAHIGTRFNILTNDVFGEQTYPLIIYSKRKLADRVAEYNEPWHTETSSVSIRSTVTPVQAAHENISPQVVEALRLCSVSLDLEVDQEALASVLSVRSHTALSLQYCRQLLLCYLAGYGKGNIKPSSSPVSSFHPGTAGASKLYDKPGDLFVSPLSTSSYGLIVSTYEKTIEMLHVKGKTDLAVQAMHELGNVLFHSGNTKGAFKWWCDALDTLLHVTNSLQNWHSFTPETLLNKCQIWGCLLGACIASNISQYVVSHSLDDRVDICLLSAQLFKALFHASLPHPSSDYEYVTYEIGEGFNIPSLIPGIDLLSDQFRCNASLLVGALHYVSETLVRHRYAIQALPVLTLYHYVAMSLLSDTKHLILARILKVEALTQLSMLSEALQLWSLVSQTEALPTPPTSHSNNISNKTNVPEFSITEPLNSPKNVCVVEHAIKCKIPPVPQHPFTTNLSALAQLAHAGLLLALAQRSSVIPTYVEGNDQPTESSTKYKLCNSAEVILMHLSKCAEKEDAHYCELEVGVNSCKLLCDIALSKQLGATMVNLSNHGLTLLQRSYVLERQEITSYDEMCSKRRLDGLAWLQLKCTMIQGFGIMTTMYGANDCREICAVTREEAELFNSSEIRAWIALKELVLDINADNTFHVERQIKEAMSVMVAPSCLGAGVSVGAILYCASRTHDRDSAMSRLKKVRELLEYQHEHYYGKKHNIHTYMAPSSALAVVLEADWKISDISDKILSGGDVTAELSELEEILTDTLKHSNIGVALKSELLIRLGVVIRARWEVEPTPERFVLLINTLCDCVSASNFYLPVAREAFLEIAYVTSSVTNNGDATASKQVTLEKRAAWSAIKAASLCNVSQDKLKCLEQNPKSQALLQRQDFKRLPIFTGLELNRKMSTELLHPKTKAQQPRPPSNLSWVKLLSYLETLKRDLQTQGFSGQCPMSSPGLSAKITVLQDYLATAMPGWSSQCNIPVVSRNISYLTMGRVLAGTPSTTTSSRESSSLPSESVPPSDSAPEGGIVLQWHCPRLVTRIQDTTRDMLVYYALNMKSVKTSSPMFTSNSFTGFKAVASSTLESLHTKVEYAHARAVIEEETLKKYQTTPLPPASTQPPTSVQPPSSRGSTKASISPEPYEPNEIQVGVVDALTDFLGLDLAITKEVLEQPDFLTSEKLSILDNLLTVNSVPQTSPDLCRWLLSFVKVLPKPSEKNRATPATKDTPLSK
ncbi:hypothetical protein ACHWQZ_G004738 [Mnemiopsis leidyi]